MSTKTMPLPRPHNQAQPEPFPFNMPRPESLHLKAAKRPVTGSNLRPKSHLVNPSLALGVHDFLPLPLPLSRSRLLVTAVALHGATGA